MFLFLSIYFFVVTLISMRIRTTHGGTTRVVGLGMFLFSLFFFLQWVGTLDMSDFVKLAFGNIVVIVSLVWLMFFSMCSKSAPADKNDIK